MRAIKRNLLPTCSDPNVGAKTAWAPQKAVENVQDRNPSLAVPSPELCFIRLNEVLTICGKSRTSVYESIKKGSFPAPIKLGGRSSAWVKSEVLQWAKNCVDSSRMK